jgi:ribosome-associated heat shock protein Hsp15
MRIDKYIWAIRIVKTRSQASAVCKDGKVEIDGYKVKASRVLKKGETIVVRNGAVYFSYQVVQFPKSRVGAALVMDYTKDVTAEDQLEKLKMIKLSHMDRPRGVGRPTKRDRRDWEKAFED